MDKAARLARRCDAAVVVRQGENKRPPERSRRVEF